MDALTFFFNTQIFPPTEVDVSDRFCWLVLWSFWSVLVFSVLLLFPFWGEVSTCEELESTAQGASSKTETVLGVRVFSAKPLDLSGCLSAFLGSSQVHPPALVC